MTALNKGRYSARIAQSAADLVACQRLRALAFLKSTDPDRLDRDPFDATCSHFMVEEQHSGRLVCCFRLLHLTGGAEIERSYSAQFYELSALSAFEGPMIELGRFCIHPDMRDPDILRVAWGAMTRYVDQHGVEMLFGCSSFQGVDAETYLDAFAMLAARHIAPRRWLPRIKAPSVFRFAQKLARRRPDTRLAMLRMPPLLRTYLLMGGWVSDHAVVDRQLDTLHVFTGLEIAAIPDARKRLLRAVAAPSGDPVMHRRDTDVIPT
ncbi:ornithine-acyl[acyl carrier protein] N-acyltransferase [Roseovarius litoreus]|uniref:L-ornithine N(alpha)-acyltransferase n=1 Tax=Roseovarius litoreus TaxID=1155722 RepID=A0A1M7GQG5_9RHOB|nr:GNAT family N-acetyltransferase [Roseovarius litoreus]SHM18445.1 ornithine-acyl[acyl carrier protein] N-acyltransferase [Roseovarius litoreus]